MDKCIQALYELQSTVGVCLKNVLSLNLKTEYFPSMSRKNKKNVHSHHLYSLLHWVF